MRQQCLLMILMLTCLSSHAQINVQSDSQGNPVLNTLDRSYMAGITIAQELLIDRYNKGVIVPNLLSIDDFMDGFNGIEQQLTAQSPDSLVEIIQNPKSKIKGYSRAIGSLTKLLTKAESIDPNGVKRGIRNYFGRTLKVNVEYATSVFYGRDISDDKGLFYPNYIGDNTEREGIKEAKEVTMPHMDGVDAKTYLNRIMGKLLKYPDMVYKKDKAKDMVVTIMFIIEKDGYISNYYVEKGSGNKLMDAEALHTIALLPKFEPAMADGEPYRCFFHLPFTFKPYQ